MTHLSLDLEDSVIDDLPLERVRENLVSCKTAHERGAQGSQVSDRYFHPQNQEQKSGRWWEPEISVDMRGKLKAIHGCRMSSQGQIKPRKPIRNEPEMQSL
jgi:hypothetical protein